MITPEEFRDAQTVVKCILETIWNPVYEEDFKRKLLNRGLGWKEDDYQITSCHMSGYHFRVECTHNDLRKRVLVLSGEDVYNWYTCLQEEILK